MNVDPSSSKGATVDPLSLKGGGATVDLLSLTAALVDIPSVSHHEQVLADRVEARLRTVEDLEVVRVGDNVVARTEGGRAARVILAGHLDTVPPNGNERARLDGDTLWGLGSADMKGGLAVMLALAPRLASAALDVTLVFYAAEEVARRHSGLLVLAVERPELLAGDVAIVGEPTSGRIEAGCQGVLRVLVSVGGKRAHSARPWRGVNAIHRLGPLLDAIANFPERRPIIDGCEYREALQVVAVEGGVAGNVVPDHAQLTLNHRFAPDRDVKDADAALRSLLGRFLDPGAGDQFTLLDQAAAAPPSLGHPLITRLQRYLSQPPRAKLGWTDVAFFAERGIPAVNLGPGDPELAHAAQEHVTRDELHHVYRVLDAFFHHE